MKRPKQNQKASNDFTGQGKSKEKRHKSPLPGRRDYTVGVANIKKIK